MKKSRLTPLCVFDLLLTADCYLCFVEAGKLALTNFIKDQGAVEHNTVVTLVDEQGNQMLVVQRDPQSTDPSPGIYNAILRAPIPPQVFITRFSEHRSLPRYL